MKAKRQYMLSKIAEADVMRRAAIAYLGGIKDQPGNWPDEADSAVESYGGHLYAVLRSRSERNRRSTVLAVYRVRHDGQLKLAVRRPAGLVGG